MSLKVGDVVMIYQRPLTDEQPKGKAKLLSQYRPDDGDGLSMWLVEFPGEPGSQYLRTVREPVSSK